NRNFGLQNNSTVYLFLIINEISGSNPMGATTQHGYLVLAYHSGYTSFVAGTELDHSHEILSDLLETICMQIEKLLTIHKLEGDAVFAYAPEAIISRGETILELIEVHWEL